MCLHIELIGITLSQVRLRLFGTPLIEAQDQPIRFENRKAVALLAYLAVSRAAQSREKVAALLWPDIEQSLAALRTAVWELRKKIGDQYLITTNQEIGLVIDNGFSADVLDFLGLLQTSAKSTLEATRRIDLLQRAVTLYQDDFMVGFTLRDSPEYDDWQSAQTTHFQRLQQRALLDLTTLYEEIGDDYSAIQTAERLRFMDRLAQEPVEALMRLYLKSGQRQSCHRLYEEYSAELKRELDVEPDHALIALYQSIANPSVDTASTSRRSVRPVTGPIAAGNITASIYRSADMVIGRPRKMFGRDELIAKILNLLYDGEQVMLTGMGGIGKTSTAAAVAADYITTTGQPVIWLETGYQKADEMLLALARAFDQQQTLLTKADPAAFVMQLLVAQKGLLVLDNCWNAPALFEVMRAVPNSLPVLFTSRQRIPIDGEIIAVDALNMTHARDLLIYHARRDFKNDPDVDALLRSLGNHPYALAIAGKQLKAQPGLSTKDLRSRYMKSTREIAVVGGYGEQERQSIEHIIAHSVDTVSHDARKMLLHMGSLAAPHASLELLALILDTDLDSLESAAAELEQASLIDIQHAASLDMRLYQMHDLTFNYCRDLFKHTGLDRSRLVRGISAYMQRYSHDKIAVQQEFTNLMGAIRAATHLKDDAAVIYMVRAIMNDGYFDAFGYTPELLEHLHEAIQLAQNAGDSQRESLHYLLSKHANVLQMQGNYEDAFQINLEALAVAPTPERRALLATTLGSIAFRLKREEYQLYLNEAEAIARTHDIHEVLSRVLEIRGHVALSENDLEQARVHFLNAVEYSVKLNMLSRIFHTLYNLAFVEIELKNYVEAEVTLNRAFQLAVTDDNDLWKGMCFSSIGRCTHARGDRDETSRLMSQALQIYEHAGALPFANWVRNFLISEGYIT